MGTTRIWLVRHGAVENPGDILYGRLPGIRLSKAGRAQAEDVAKRLRPEVLFSSPRLRTRQTAAAIASACGGLRIRTSRLLDETKTGAEGLPRSVVEARGWDLSHFATEGSETAEDILRRMRTFLSRAARFHRGEEIAAVTHGDPIAILVAWTERGVVVEGGVRNALAALGLEYPGCGAVVRFELSADGAEWGIG